VLEAVNYDMGANGVAYLDYTYEDPAKFTGDSKAWNNGWTYRNDGVDIQTALDNEGSLYNIGWMENGEWLHYTVDVPIGGVFQISLRISSQNNNGLISCGIPSQSQEIVIGIPNTGGYQNWDWTDPDTLEIVSGTALISLTIYNGGFNLKDIKLTLLESNNTIPDNFKILSYPNPFNSMTRFLIPDGIKYQRITIFDINGRVVQDSRRRPFLLNGLWNGRDGFDAPASSGAYFFEIEVDRQLYNGKMTLIR